MAAQDACRGQHFLVHVALCVPNMSISISMWVRPVPEKLSKALPKIERTARLVQESTGLLFRYIPNG